METWLEYLKTAIDRRESWKVLHKLSDIIAIVFFALLANANEWEEIEIFAVANEEILCEYLELPNGIPSHDTIQRNFAVLDPDFLKNAKRLWNEILSSNESVKIRQMFHLDGKTQRGNGNSQQKANHIVSAVDEDGICFEEQLVDEKSNEITAIPKLLDDLNIQGHIITSDAMGAQREIVAKIRKKGADYVIGLKGNQETLHDDVKSYFEDEELRKKCEHTYKVEKARSGIEKREYWLLSDVSWLPQKEKWDGLQSVGMTRNTIIKGDQEAQETRYFISSLSGDAKLFAKAVRSHWMVESMHNHLDVTFREDANQTLDKRAAYNMNIMRKMALNTLKLVELSGKTIKSLRKKRYAISVNFKSFLNNLFAV